MQEEMEQRTIAISLRAAVLTGRTLAKALALAVRKIQKSQQNTPPEHGNQSVKKLMKQGCQHKHITA